MLDPKKRSRSLSYVAHCCFRADTRKDAAIALLCVVASATAVALQPVLLKCSIDAVLVHGEVLAQLILFIAAILFGDLFASFGDVASSKLQQRISFNISIDFLKKISRVNINEIIKKNPTEIYQIISTARSGIQTIVQTAVGNLLPVIFKTLLSLLILFALNDWEIALAIVIYIVTYGFQQHHSTKILLRTRQAMIEEMSKSAKVFGDTVANMDFICAQGLSPLLYERYSNNQNSLFEIQSKYNKFIVLSRCSRALCFTAIFSYCMWRAVDRVQTGGVPIGHIVLVSSYLFQICTPLTGLFGMVRAVREAFSGVSPYVTLVEIDCSRSEKLPLVLNGPIQTISMNGLAFRYGDRNHSLVDVNINLSKGKVYGFIGESGSGKSTLLKLILGVCHPTRGSLLFNEMDLRKFSKQSIQENITYIPQDSAIFNESLEFNIRIAKPDATASEIAEAAKAACLSDLIQRLPHGMNSIIGDRGLAISGGERQRIGIARALLRNAPVLLIDEGTSAIDTRTEKWVLGSLLKRRSEKITIIVAHRESTLMDVDFIFRIQGTKVEAVPKGCSEFVKSPPDTH
ncbi:ABC transporter ATP-binding protein [Burkholderia gladioli]|uniref:ABC transporter ATP-binding protein n=1 Tax=Burkholderia gladioli TaxID=28095 RepID=UPI00163F26EF|nr:ABC transporter ATP-binding protein [Burkholderia gladioli]